MSLKKGDRGAFEFTAAAWDEVELSQHSFKVVWAVACLPTKRRGVWKVSIQVVDRRPGADPVPIVRYEAEWPNVRAQSYEAFLYGTCHCAARMVEEWALQWGAEEARARGF